MENIHEFGQLKSEAEIVKNWDKKYSEPLVSVMCLAYNHEKYIEDALKGFLIQETDFPFEVLIHDDASTDNTADIIREYEALYPNIIKPVYQSENQWSRDKEVIRNAQYGRVKGKYLAYCDGDDYWVDPKKLQKQVKFLEKNIEYVVCGHGFIVKYENKKIERRMFAYDQRRYGSFRYLQALKGSPLHPNTWMCHSKVIICNRYLDIQDKFPAGDDFLMLILMSTGKGYCLPEFMSVYRVNDSSTWSSIKTYIKKLKMFAYQVYSFQVMPLRFYIPQIIYSIVNLSDALIGVLRDTMRTSDLKKLSMFNSEISKIDSNRIFVLSLIMCAFLFVPLRVIILILAKIFKKIHLCV